MKRDEDGKRYLSRRVLDILFMCQIFLTVLVLTLVVAYTITTAARVAEINRRQIEYGIQQNNAALCNQHDIIISVKHIAERLGLQSDDILVPNVEGLNCP